MEYKRIILEVPAEFHKVAKKQAKELNMTLKSYVLHYIYSPIIERENIKELKN